MAQSMKMMNTMMPLMSAFFCFTLPAGMGLYWIAGSVVRSIQQVVINKHIDKMDIDEIIKVTGEAYELISVLRHNLIKRSRLSERDEFHEWAFPSGQREKMMLMGFPIEKD